MGSSACCKDQSEGLTNPVSKKGKSEEDKKTLVENVKDFVVNRN